MIKNAVLQTIYKFSLIEENTVVTVALSGGADSVALLHALNSLKDRLKITLKAAHLNHLIRGDEAFRDEEFVKILCNSLNIPLFCERINVPEFAEKNGLSLETAARQVRYEFFNRVNEGVIATAHTASDNLETMLLNLARGTAVDGLSGIPIKRGNIIRPIISCTREMVEKYCEDNNLDFVTDSTNLTDDYTRNKIRHKIVPVLKEINPHIEKTVLKTSNALRNTSMLIKNEASYYISRHFTDNTLKLEGFSSINPEIAKKIIVEFVNMCDKDISLEACHIENIHNICIRGGKTSIPKGKYCLCAKERLTVGIEGEKTEKPQFSVKIIEKKEKINNLLLNNSLDCDKIVGKLVVRTRQPGDSIRLLNRGCTKALTKLYNECAVPVNIREALPVISDDLGVVWIFGIGVAQRCAVNEKTKTACVIKVKENES